MSKSLLAITAAIWLAAHGHASARDISSDVNARFLPMTIHKSVVMDLSRDIKDVLVAHPLIAQAYVQSARRVYIVAIGLGQTNVYFYDSEGRQIEALDVAVQDYPVQPTSPGPETVMIMFRGPKQWVNLSCTNTSEIREGAACYIPHGAPDSPTLDSLPAGSSVTIPAGGR